MKNLNNKTQSGFTLVELAISTTIVGLLIAAVLLPFSVWLEDKKFETTAENVEQVTWGVSAFHVANGYYPCPAPIDAARDDPDYGRAGDCFETPVAIGSCSAAGGRYCVAGGRTPGFVDLNGDGNDDDLDDDGNPDSVGIRRVRIGTIPFRDLNMPEEFAYDSYGNRILYAVTEDLAYDVVPGPPATENFLNLSALGGIEVLNDSGQSHLDVPGSANFVVLSHGADGVGGYNRQGVSNGDPCNEGTANETLDSQNCDHLDGVNINADFFVSELAEAGDGNQHDDIVRFQIPLNAPLWARSSTSPESIYSIPSTDNPDGRVAGDFNYNRLSQPTLPDGPDADSDPDPDTAQINAVYANSKLWVGGNILLDDLNVATQEQVQSHNICNRDGDNCFPASAIGGPVGTKCPPGMIFIKGVYRNDAGTSGDVLDDEIVGECQSSIDFSCAPGELIRGVSDGRADCVPRPCPSQTRSECGDSYTLNAAEHGSRQTVHLGDNECRSATFVCNAGTWSGSFSGMCSCTNETITTPAPCAAIGCLVTGRTDRVRRTTTTCGFRNCRTSSRFVGTCHSCSTPTPTPGGGTDPDPTSTPGGGTDPGVGDPACTGGAAVGCPP